jgi:hypothetical protein
MLRAYAVCGGGGGGECKSPILYHSKVMQCTAPGSSWLHVKKTEKYVP